MRSWEKMEEEKKKGGRERKKMIRMREKWVQYYMIEESWIVWKEGKEFEVYAYWIGMCSDQCICRDLLPLDSLYFLGLISHSWPQVSEIT